MSDYEYRVNIPDTPLWVNISKVGGGTVGKSYEGTWEYQITGPDVLFSNDDLRTGTPHTHEYVAALIPTFFYEELEEWDDQIALYNEQKGDGDNYDLENDGPIDYDISDPYDKEYDVP